MVSAGVVPTPAVAYLARTEGFDAGIVISASHNPYEDNGIKVFGGAGDEADRSSSRRRSRRWSPISSWIGAGRARHDRSSTTCPAHYVAHLDVILETAGPLAGTPHR